MTQTNDNNRFEIKIEVGMDGGAVRILPTTTPKCPEIIDALHGLCREFQFDDENETMTGTYTVSFDGEAFTRNEQNVSLDEEAFDALDKLARQGYDWIQHLKEQLPVALMSALVGCICGMCEDQGGELDRIVTKILGNPELFGQLDQIGVLLEDDEFSMPVMTESCGFEDFTAFMLGRLTKAINRLMGRGDETEQQKEAEISVEIPMEIFPHGLTFEKAFMVDLMRPIVVDMVKEALSQRLRGEQIRLDRDRVSLASALAMTQTLHGLEADLAHEQYTFEDGLEERMEADLQAEQFEESERLEARHARELEELQRRQAEEIEEMEADHAQRSMQLPDDIRLAKNSFVEAAKVRHSEHEHLIRALESSRGRFNDQLAHFTCLVSAMTDAGFEFPSVEIQPIEDMSPTTAAGLC